MVHPEMTLLVCVFYSRSMEQRAEMEENYVRARVVRHNV